MFRGDVTGGRAVVGTLRDGMETLEGEFAYTLPAHRMREIARLALRHGWDIDGARRAAGMPAPAPEQHTAQITSKTATGVFQRLWRSSRHRSPSPHGPQPETTRSHAHGKPVAPSPWQATRTRRTRFS
jgi:hypothetical protein